MKRNQLIKALGGTLVDFREPGGSSLLDRAEEFFEWQENRRRHELWPYSKASFTSPTTECSIAEDTGRQLYGVNFASQDYLSLASHPAVHDAAVDAIREFGVHSAGSTALLGNTRYSLQLEQAIADILRMEHVLLYPTGWGAGYGIVTGLVRPRDHIIMDILSHACLQEGAAASNAKVRRFRHNNLDHLRIQLERIRRKDTENGILVITEGLFSMDSDAPALDKMQDLCHEYDATLLVDIAHDFGAMGPGGTGTIGALDLLGKVDLVMGSFSKTFASNGGFIATRRREVKEYLKFFSNPQTFSNALSPCQAATVIKALEIVRSSEGDERRRRLMKSVEAFRNGIEEEGIEVAGTPSPIVPVIIGELGLMRLASRRLSELGVLANTVEYPAVAQGRARFRFQLMADHTVEQATVGAKALGEALRAAREEYDSVISELADARIDASTA